MTTEQVKPARRRVTPSFAKQEVSEALHVAVCQAVELLNRAPEMARCTEGREAHKILRQALINYANAHIT